MVPETPRSHWSSQVRHIDIIVVLYDVSTSENTHSRISTHFQSASIFCLKSSNIYSSIYIYVCEKDEHNAIDVVYSYQSMGIILITSFSGAGAAGKLQLLL